MPDYSYDKDYPFAAFITNLGKYNEGELVGEWVKFPTTYDELQKVFEQIGIGKTDDFGQPYEEWFITDYDCYVGGLYDKLGEYENLDELNYLASKLDEMDRGEYNQFLAAMEVGDHSGSLQEIINLTENLDCYDVYPDIEDHDDLGRYYIDELDAMQVPEHLKNYIDYEAYGRDVALEEGGDFTEFGYVRDTGSSFHAYYDGDRDSIPEEYRVMSRPEAENELTQDEKLDMAADLAFDQDTFSIYQLKGGAALQDYRFESLDSLQRAGLSVKSENYELIYTAPLTETDDLESIFTKFNIDRPEDFHGHSLSVSDVVVFHQDGKDTAHYCDSAGFAEVPQFLEPVQEPDNYLTGDTVRTPRGSFRLTDLTKEQMEAAGYGFHHASDDGCYQIMANGTRAFAIRSEIALEVTEPEKMTVLVVEPMKEPYVKEIDSGLDALQAEVGGNIAAVYPFHDPVALVCHDEGKLIGLDLNRSLQNEQGEVYDIVAGPFLMVGLGAEDFASLSPEYVQKYTEHFKCPEVFASINGQIISVPIEPDNPLRTAEMTLEDDYGMIDGVINNGRRGEELETAKETAAKTISDKKPSIMERLEDAKRECAGRKSPDKAAPQKKPPELGDL